MLNGDVLYRVWQASALERPIHNAAAIRAHQFESVLAVTGFQQVEGYVGGVPASARGLAHPKSVPQVRPPRRPQDSKQDTHDAQKLVALFAFTRR